MTPNIQAYRADGGDIGTDRIKEIANNPYGDEEKCWLAKRVLALLDELEAKDKAWSAQDNHINQQADRIESLEKKNGELGRALGAAEKRIAELAAENAGLKESRKNLAEFIHDELNADYPLNMDIETPATSSFLAEVRAQGVDVAIEHLINKFEGTGRIGVPIMALEWLAKELRKGVQS
ncbi:hypothetical protein [Enterobacter hormaechei]|uniref:hypothetical protein n=1 Tax=Enterobacter hormaechei TaxID=158836 RepID=UPI00403B0111